MQESNLFKVLFCVQIFIFVQNITAEESNAYNETVRNRLRRIFHTSDGSIPEFEIVDVRLSKGPQKRNLHKNSSGVYFRTLAFGKDINLWLYPPNDLVVTHHTPVYHAGYSANAPGKIRYTKRAGLMEAFGDLYEDPGTWTSLVVSSDEYNGYHVNGYMGSMDAVIISLPCTDVETLRKHRQSNNHHYSPSKNSHCHIVFKANSNTEPDRIFPTESDQLPDFNVTSFPDGLPDTLYPEILAVVDHSAYQYSNNATDDTEILSFLKYVVTLWNGVNLKYKSLTNPAVRLSISAIVFSEEPRATPYIFDNLMGSAELNSTAALLDATRTYYDVRGTFPITSYDVIMTMTRLQAISNPGLKSPSFGASLYKGACRVNPSRKEVHGLSIFHDNSAFSGIHNAARALGYLLGATDEFPIPHCYPALGYIMSPIEDTENSADFSKCSRLVFEARFQKLKFECMYNRPRGRKIPKFMPGRLIDLEGQCKAYGFSRSCSNDASICRKLRCTNDQGACVQTGKAALDGTQCSPLSSDWFCLHMECIEFPFRQQ